MKAILVFIDGTICDGRARYHLIDTDAFHDRKWMLKDTEVAGSVACLQELASRYKIVYIGTRPPSAKSATEEWLRLKGFPQGPVCLGKSQADRIEVVSQLKNDFDFIAGIGDRWDDNELHLELGCLSVIVKEHEGDWGKVSERITSYHKKMVVDRNRAFVEGKVEGLARVCPLLLKKYGGQLWETYQDAVREMAENSREERRVEDLDSFRDHNLDPEDLRDISRWYKLLDEENWETESLFGLQNRLVTENTKTRFVEKITQCYLAELWKNHGLPEIGYQIHCCTDAAWWNRPAWNSKIRFEQPQTLMQGHDSCIFIQYIPENGEV